MAKSIRAALGIATILIAFPPAFGRPPCCPNNIIVQFYADVCDADRTALAALLYQPPTTNDPR